MQLPQRVAERGAHLVEHVALLSEPQFPRQCSYAVVDPILPHMITCRQRYDQCLAAGGTTTCLHRVEPEARQPFRDTTAMTVM